MRKRYFNRNSINQLRIKKKYSRFANSGPVYDVQKRRYYLISPSSHSRCKVYFKRQASKKTRRLKYDALSNKNTNFKKVYDLAWLIY